MDMKNANPFLFTEDDYTSPSSGNSNPFLMGGEDFPATSGDNPFLSQTATTVSSGNSTNPFAFDPMDLGPSESALTADIPATTNSYDFGDNSGNIEAANNMFSSTTSDFSAPMIAPQKPTDLDLKFTCTMDQNNTNVVDFNDGVENNQQHPSRPPPPRPPPSKETQDLLMSVMGAMDATSSHLLDRIPPTRTPSPVSMRDLHSPSPTPEPQTQDLLDMNDTTVQQQPVIEEKKPVSHSEDLLMNLGQETDINQNPPLIAQNIGLDLMDQMTAPIPHPVEVTVPVAHVPPQRPGPPIRPPRPQPPPPPQKPPQPAFGSSPVNEVNHNHETGGIGNGIQPIVAPTHIGAPHHNGAPPPKPPPPSFNKSSPTSAQVNPTQQNAQVTSNEMEMMDMFGVDSVPQKPTIASTADIMNLYNKPVVTKAEPPVTDLLFDSLETTMAPIEQVPAPEKQSNDHTPMSDVFGTNDSLHETTPSSSVVTEIGAEPFASTPIVQDNFISPEPSQADLQMDTSDSQSKGSVSSVTFNPFAAGDEGSPGKQTPFLDNNTNLIEDNTAMTQEVAPTIFGVPPVAAEPTHPKANDDFDDFAAKFESAAKDENRNGVFDAFTGVTTANAWGNDSTTNAFGDASAGFGDTTSGFGDTSSGFGGDESFDAFLALQEPPAVPQSTPNKMSKIGSQDSDEDKDFNVFIKPKGVDDYSQSILPVLAPPPVQQAAFSDSSPRFNPFDQSESVTTVVANEMALPLGGPELTRTDSQETPPTPLFDDDVSQPLEPFPRVIFQEEGWEMQLRQPNKKKITGQRFWKKIFVKLVHQADCVLLQLFNQVSDKDPFQELPLQPCYSVSDIGAQQYDTFGKIFTLKLQYIFYKERPGVRPGQVKKAERITNKLSQFAAYAIQGDYQGVKEFGSDLRKLGLPVEHAPQVSQLMKLGSLNFEDLKQFSVSIEEALFKLQAHRDRALHYKMEEVQITAVDELYVEQNSEGHVEKQIARVRLFFLGFLTGMPDVELGINDMRRQGKEVVGRHDIIPVVTEEWIRLEDVEFHNCVQQDEYEKTHIIKFKPPDACYIELLRFRVRPPKNRELPLQLKPTIVINGNKIELRADVLVPGFASRKLGQVPCEDVMIRFPIPECWIYMFRVEKHFRYGSVKSAHRRTGKIKGIERILGTVDTLQESLIEVTSGQAKYEHQHRAIVWRCPRLPKEGQGAYTTHNMVCKLALTSYDQMPEQLAEYCYVEFTMPATQASHTTVRSVSLQNSDSDEPPEKYVRYLARHEYKVGIEHTEGDGPNAYSVATVVKPAPVQEEPPKPIPEADSSSDSD